MNPGDFFGPLLGFIGLLISLGVSRRGKRQDAIPDVIRAEDEVRHAIVDQLQEEVARYRAQAEADRAALEAAAESLALARHAHDESLWALRSQLQEAKHEAELLKLRLREYGEE